MYYVRFPLSLRNVEDILHCTPSAQVGQLVQDYLQAQTTDESLGDAFGMGTRADAQSSAKI